MFEYCLPTKTHVDVVWLAGTDRLMKVCNLCQGAGIATLDKLGLVLRSEVTGLHISSGRVWCHIVVVTELVTGGLGLVILE